MVIGGIHPFGRLIRVPGLARCIWAKSTCEEVKSWTESSRKLFHFIGTPKRGDSRRYHCPVITQTPRVSDLYAVKPVAVEMLAVIWIGCDIADVDIRARNTQSSLWDLAETESCRGEYQRCNRKLLH